MKPPRISSAEPETSTRPGTQHGSEEGSPAETPAHWKSAEGTWGAVAFGEAPARGLRAAEGGLTNRTSSSQPGHRS